MKTALIALAALLTGAASPDTTPGYAPAKTIALGAPDRWDYVVFNGETGRVYVAHGDRVTVVDATSGAIVGEVEGIAGGTHGVGISTETGQGFTDDGRNGQAVAFDLKTLKITRQVAADADADAVTFDRKTGHVFVIDGDPGTISVIDPKTITRVALIKAGEKMEYAVTDDNGALFVAGEEKSDLLKIDVRTNAIVAHWATPGCTDPHGLAIDKAHARLFMGCVNNLMEVVDSRDGHVIATLPIGSGSDAIAFDAKRGRVFSSNGRDGTITVYQQVSADIYRAMTPITTAVSGRTMSVDAATGRLFVVAADTDPADTPGGRAKVRPGTLKLLMFDPR
ncbi:hypothetical protein QH494_27560 [Sphingomonas sp. AR_OL41]|uniref:hypothetical protein n=1 Tax=Sphingomonas sp. AR_OL41 TaxID=3042729 RepID=UPI0024815F53|nr:hypothetical protein [Sphingomonas sp. AR_OL41]MDH7975954.1 hypothetical protein [Sphingomonas sp. AR_OL41]